MVASPDAGRSTKSPWSSTSVRTCRGCNVALYCCKEHRKYILQDGHARVCGTPPFRVPGKEEERLCEAVAACFNGFPEGAAMIEPNEDSCCDYISDNDESVWESVDSDEEEQVGAMRATDIIYNFFRKSYDVRRVKEPAFARFYSDD